MTVAVGGITPPGNGPAGPAGSAGEGATGGRAPGVGNGRGLAPVEAQAAAVTAAARINSVQKRNIRQEYRRVRAVSTHARLKASRSIWNEARLKASPSVLRPEREGFSRAGLTIHVSRRLQRHDLDTSCNGRAEFVTTLG